MNIMTLLIFLVNKNKIHFSLKIIILLKNKQNRNRINFENDDHSDSLILKEIFIINHIKNYDMVDVCDQTIYIHP